MYAYSFTPPRIVSLQFAYLCKQTRISNILSRLKDFLRMNKLFSALILSVFAGELLMAQATPTSPSCCDAKKQAFLFVTDGTKPHPYRIPAIAQASDGTLIAVSDYRPCGMDIGNGRVDIVARLSFNNGATWQPEFAIRRGTGQMGKTDCGFGDAAIAADVKSKEVVVISVCGNTPFFSATRENPNRVALFRSHDNGRTWTDFEEITDKIYPLFDKSQLGALKSLFFTSGKIFQSRIIKHGKYYRIYTALCTRDNGNNVLFSDDFGKTWNVLGSIDVSAVPKGDEAKCDELPDGSVVISSRTYNGRFFNIFTYSDTKNGRGAWGKAALSNAANRGIVPEDNSCNGELLIIPAKRRSDNADVYIALQSVPFGKGRSRVGIYYKALSHAGNMDSPQSLASEWDGRYQVSNLGSAYSTMTMLNNGKLAFFYEEETFGMDYTNVYREISLEEITGNTYSYNPKLKRKAFVKRMKEKQKP